MSYIGISSPIPDISSLPGQTGGEIEVTLDYPSAAVCNGDDAFSPSSATPPGGTFGAEPSGLNINPSTGVVTPVGSTPQAYTISYTVSGVTSQFALTINNVEQSTFSYSASSFQKIGTATPTLASGTTAGGTFSASTGVVINPSTGVIDLAASTIGGPYTITYTTPGACSTSSPFTLSITAVSVEIIDNDFAMEFNGFDQYVSAGLSSAFNSITSGSWQFWIKTSNNEADYKPIFSKDRTSGNRPFLIVMYSGKLRVYLHPNGSSFTYVNNPTNITINDGEWNHIVVTYNGTNTVKIYKNGGSPVFTETSLAGTGGLVDNLAAQTMIGRFDASMAGSTWEYLEGDLDEVAFWKRELSQEDVQRIYNATANNPGKTANLFTAGLNTGLVYWNRMGD